jgi:hypothetical protein
MRKLALLFAATMVMTTGCDDDDDDDVVIPGELPDETFTITLTTQDEVPICAAASTNATGAAVVTINGERTTITLDTLTFRGLSSPVSAAHIHAGDLGIAGPIVFTLAMGDDVQSPVGPITFTAADYPSPAPEGAPETFGGFVATMITGGTYINVHTRKCPEGEIRGQL